MGHGVSPYQSCDELRILCQTIYFFSLAKTQSFCESFYLSFSVKNATADKISPVKQQDKFALQFAMN